MIRRVAQSLVPLLPVVLLVACGPGDADHGGEPLTSSRPSGTTGERCADMVVLGARGSTQDPDLNAGVGTEVRVTTEKLVELVHARADLSVRLEAVRYDSDATGSTAEYLDHTADGSRLMEAQLRDLAAACPDSRFALIGFSQGAQVVHGVADSMETDLADRVSLVAMIADPLRDPSDTITHVSYAAEPATNAGRLGAGPPVDADLRPAAISLCVAGDEICNDRGAPGGAPSQIHRHFYEKPVNAALTAARLDAVLQRNET